VATPKKLSKSERLRAELRQLAVERAQRALDRTGSKTVIKAKGERQPASPPPDWGKPPAQDRASGPLKRGRKPVLLEGDRVPERPYWRYYWAYGANLSERAMAHRCPGARKIQALELTGCKLVFRGVADIEITGDERDRAVGGLWRITAHHEWELDCFEGYRSSDPSKGLYRKITFAISTADGRVHDVMFYKMNVDGVWPPSERYLDTIANGYDDFGLDKAYLDEALRGSWADKDHENEFLRGRHKSKGSPVLARAIKVASVALPPPPEQAEPANEPPAAPETDPTAPQAGDTQAPETGSNEGGFGPGAP
jgi:hypothetical protein